MTMKRTDLSRDNPKPWYRHPWPWLLMAGPLAAVVGGIVTAVLAVRSNDGLVADDYYKQGLAINQTTARDRRATEMGLQADLMLSGEDVRVILQANAATTLPEAVSLRIAHPTRAGEDQLLVLRRQASGFYAGRLARPLAGRWRIQLEDEGGRLWRLTGEWIVERSPSLRLP